MTRLSPLATLPYLYPNGTDVFIPNRRLLKNEILYSLSSGLVTIDTVTTPLLLTFNLLLGVYIHSGRFMPRPSQNHIPYYFEINRSRGVLIRVYAPDFTDSSAIPGHSIEHPVRVVLCSTTHKFRYGF